MIPPFRYDVARIHRPMADDAGLLIKNAINLVKKSMNLPTLNVAMTHVILCGGEKPNKKTFEHCKNYLHEGLTKHTDPNKPPVLLLMGSLALKAFGIKFSKMKDLVGRVIVGEVVVAGVTYLAVATISASMLANMPGLYHIFYTDLQRAVSFAGGKQYTVVPKEVLTQKYHYPATIDEVKNLVDHIIGYSENNVDPTKWAISLDTETNTLFPHLPKLKALGVSCSWGTGRSCYIPLFHKDTPYDPEQAMEHVRRLVTCEKPKIFHHFKYDAKVFRKYGIEVANYAWDTLTGEHLRYEDKSGFYGLKDLTTLRNPEFSGYADELHEAQLAAEGGDTQLDLAKKSKAEKAAEKAAASAAKKAKKKKKEDRGFEDLPLTTLAPYAAIDTDMTRRNAISQMELIQYEQHQLNAARDAYAKSPMRIHSLPSQSQLPSPLKSLMKTTVIPATKVLAKMEYRGVRIDRPLIEQMSAQLEQVYRERLTNLQRLSGNPTLNLNSTKEIISVLFEKGYDYTDPDTGVTRHILHPITAQTTRTKKGQLQTTAKVLNWLIANNGCPFSVDKILASKASKAKDTFLQNIYDLSAVDGYIHTTFNQQGTGTGRLSSTDPNLQNIPKMLAEIVIKKIFIPDDTTMVFVNADAKNAEIRILAAYCMDKELIRSILEGLDTHCFIASKIVEAVRKEGATVAKAKLKAIGLDDQYPLDYADFKGREKWEKTDKARYKMLDNFRTAVKRVVFGILYGAGAKKIAETIGISLEQADTLIKLLFTLFPAISTYIERTKHHMEHFGCVETFFGRRRRYAVAGATNEMRSRAKRQAVNFLIQSTSSDIVMNCLAEIDAPLERELGGRQLLTVHDSLGFQIPKKYVSQLEDFLKYHLETIPAQLYPWLPVPFKWDASVGENYGEQTSISNYLKDHPYREEPLNIAETAYGEQDIRAILSDDSVQ